MQLAPGLHRIGNDIVAAHLLVAAEGITLVDAALPGHYSDLRRELDALDRPITDVRGIVLTHGDSDHIGFAERLRSELGIPVFIGAGDADRARGAKPPATPKDAMKLGPTLGFAAYGLRKGMVRIPPLKEVVPVADGDVLDLPGAPVVIGMPGHSPGSIAVLAPAQRAVFVGDELTTRHVLTGVEGPQPAPFTDDQHDSSVSLDKLRGLDVDWVIPGHGAPWRGGPDALIDAYRAAEAARV
ncbi:MBL fold metallo-hydrolase [Schumannella luteola]|uniref:Glyoxylase-like metal-dependent hydrolase (Beta-lactamase superfamily II) n=1 Tax=Schumannella luteola TaxID=472059 RepID=A0A852Y807_9MICO|nr:MBL fold metallo-hydrolase [Schumannella luteola]NYG98513.1 glyoxylase-like metal-dependent hydrolase (beta-lactamase superfamily II) [Schumannella luteola]TPX01263.1 MBL fold metallo-hydrolase [Schumannella luteola]